jgi:hypothetical protein
MTSREAKQILALFRPGTADEADPYFVEARKLPNTDPEMARWFQTHCESYLALRRKFEAIPVPSGLKEQILSEHKTDRSIFRAYWRPILALAAVVVVLLGIEIHSWRAHLPDRYFAYRKRMIETALRSYSMDLLSGDAAQIREFLKSRNAPVDFSFPGGLKSAALVGCVVSSWQGNPVSMICYKSGRPLPAGDQSDLWLFVTDLKSVANPPPAGEPIFARVNKASTASWSDGNKIYLLAAVGDEAFLRRYLQR